MISGPFVHIGDIGSVLEVTGAPAIVRWLGLVIGWGPTCPTCLTARHAVQRLSGSVSPHERLSHSTRRNGDLLIATKACQRGLVATTWR